jgi:hypothetical protein
MLQILITYHLLQVPGLMMDDELARKKKKLQRGCPLRFLIYFYTCMLLLSIFMEIGILYNLM